MITFSQWLETTQTCQRCGQPAKPGLRFCGKCAKILKQEFKDSGYLQKAGFGRSFRSSDSREKTGETKFGSGHG